MPIHGWPSVNLKQDAVVDRASERSVEQSIEWPGDLCRNDRTSQRAFAWHYKRYDVKLDACAWLTASCDCQDVAGRGHDIHIIWSLFEPPWRILRLFGRSADVCYISKSWSTGQIDFTHVSLQQWFQTSTCILKTSPFSYRTRTSTVH